MEFWKMNGAGNDFIVVDDRRNAVPDHRWPELARTPVPPAVSPSAPTASWSVIAACSAAAIIGCWFLQLTTEAPWGRCAATAPAVSAATATKTAWPARCSGWRPPRAWSPAGASISGSTGCRLNDPCPYPAGRPRGGRRRRTYRLCLSWSWATPGIPHAAVPDHGSGARRSRTALFASWAVSHPPLQGLSQGRQRQLLRAHRPRTTFTSAPTSAVWRTSPTPAAPAPARVADGADAAGQGQSGQQRHRWT